MNILNIIVSSLILLTLGCSQPNQQQITSTSQVVISGNKQFDFENYKTGETPAGWSTALTGNGKMCDWKILNDNGNKYLAQVSAEKQSYRFNMIINDTLHYKDVEMSVRFKGIAGNNDRGGGMVWRYIDADNYYIARANPLEDNYTVYKVVT